MEELKDIPGLEEYFQITKQGQIWSKRTNKFLKQTVGKTGYYTISTKIGGRKGVPKCFKVHRLVAQTYIDNPENKPYVNHIDGNKLNNCVSNLEWCTASENVQHAYDIGLKISAPPKGENSHAAKLTDEQVKQIRKDFKTHTFKNKTQFIYHYMSIYKVSRSCIRHIIENRTFINAL